MMICDADPWPVTNLQSSKLTSCQFSRPFRESERPRFGSLQKAPRSYVVVSAPCEPSRFSLFPVVSVNLDLNTSFYIVLYSPGSSRVSVVYCRNELPCKPFVTYSYDSCTPQHGRYSSLHPIQSHDDCCITVKHSVIYVQVMSPNVAVILPYCKVFVARGVTSLQSRGQGLTSKRVIGDLHAIDTKFN